MIQSVTLNQNLSNNITCTEENGVKSCRDNMQDLSNTIYKLTFTIETVQVGKYKDIWNTNVEIIENSNAISYIARQVEGQITPGDIIGIGETDDFYVISSNPEKTVLLAKYNLLVGSYKDENWDIQTISTSTPGYGLQSIEAEGYGGNIYGVVKLSDTAYWMEII